MSWTDEKDDWEGDYGAIIRPYPSSIRLLFDYTSKTGKHSTRTVQVKEYGQTGFGVMLIGFCETRQAKRTIVASRISNCKNADTGESVTDVAAYLDSEYRKSVDFTIDKFFSENFDGLRILVYFFRADGKILANERSHLLKFCLEKTRDPRIGDPQIGFLLDCISEPSNQGFKVEVGRMAKENRDLLIQVRNICETCISEKKNPAALERDVIAYIDKRLNKP